MTRVGRGVVLTAALLAIAGLVALGTWQVHRLAWKRALIAQVDARVHAVPTIAPPAADRDDAYRRVVAIGRYAPGKDTLVQASTVRGPGWWVMSPLRTREGRTILVNRGYVPDRVAPGVPGGAVAVTGLLRLTEPGGGFLRSNDPAADRWYSRDVAAIARRRGLGMVANYFIDAEATNPARGGQPVGGLTIVTFPNNHLVYAVTWYILAIMTAVALFYWLVAARGLGERRR